MSKGRPERNTVDYFPHYVEHGKKMFFIENKYGNDGYTIWFKLLEELGKADYHYLDLKEKVQLMYISSILKIDENIFKNIMTDLAEMEVINKNLWKDHSIVFNQKFSDSILHVYDRRNNECMTLISLCSLLKIKCIPKACYCGTCGDGNTQTKLKKTKEKYKYDHPLQKYVSEKLPSVAKLKSQLTPNECATLISKYGKELIVAKLDSMENKNDLVKKYNSVYRTLNNWCEKEHSEGSGPFDMDKQ